MIKKILWWFFKHDTKDLGDIYLVKRNLIKVNPQWRNTMIGKRKWDKKVYFFKSTGRFQSMVYLDKDLNLLDGYSTVRIAEVFHVDNVPAIIVSDKIGR